MADGAGSGRVQSIQLLRALAALVVASLHLAFGFADHVGPGLGLSALEHRHGQLAQVAVDVFFLVSGFVMVVSADRLFGQPHGTRQFLTRRLVRIVPSYWIATLLLAGLLWAPAQPPEAGALLWSLAFVPQWQAGNAQPLPLLWPGWTLLYEMAFYLLFGLGVWAGRRASVMISAAGLVLLAAIGLFVTPEGPVAFALTRPLVLLFLPGLALALWRGRGGRLALWLRLALAGAAIAVLLLAPASPPAGQSLIWTGLPALLLFLAAVGGDWRVPCGRLVDEAGNASYALYLLHVPLAHLWAATYPGRLFALGPWAYFLGLLGSTLVASLLFWRFVERPLTRWLNSRLLRS